MRTLRLLPVVPLLGLALLAPAAASAQEDPCARQDALVVPGAEEQLVTCQPDLNAETLSTKGFSDVTDWAPLNSKRSTDPDAGPGIQVDGCFPDDSTTNGYRGWNHDSQFVLRLVSGRSG